MFGVEKEFAANFEPSLKSAQSRDDETINILDISQRKVVANKRRRRPVCAGIVATRVIQSCRPTLTMNDIQLYCEADANGKTSERFALVLLPF